MDEKEKTVTVNGQIMNETQFAEKKQQINESKGASIVEVSKDTYKTKLTD